jgi:predicted RecB family nuclease
LPPVGSVLGVTPAWHSNLMKRISDRMIYSPTDLMVYFDSPFASWMDRQALEFPGAYPPASPDAQLQLVAAHGIEHEKRFLAELRRDAPGLCEIPETAADRFEATLAAMHEGCPVIYQAALRCGDFEGYADFLFRVETPSPKLGLSWSYTVADTKLAKKPKPYFLIQLCAYSEMLEGTLGCRPEYVELITGDGTRRRFRTDDFFYYYQAVKRAFLAAQAAFDPASQPDPDPGCDHRRWSDAATRILEEKDHLCRVAGITRNQMKRLTSAGIATLRELAVTNITDVKVDPTRLARLKQQARLQRESASLPQPLYELVDVPHPGERLGLALLPPASRNDVFFDMEGYPFADGGLEYLFGATYLENDKLQYSDFWALHASEEKRAFEAFVDWAFTRYESDGTMHIYHYAAYEASAMRRLMSQYGTRERQVDALLRGEVFVDLYQVVRQAVRIGEPRYSLKNVERLYRARREGDVSTAGESIAEFARWLEDPDGPSWRESPILADIRRYNRDDCESTYQLALWLRQRQAEAAIAWVAPPARDDAAMTPELETAAEKLAGQLLAAIPQDRSDDSERWRVQELLAYLVEFHRRSDRPMWWAYYARLSMTDEELADDPDCLGALRRTSKPRDKNKRSWLYEYEFDAEQETKLHEGSNCCIARFPDLPVSIASLDPRGRVVLKSTQELPEALSLLPYEYIKPEPIPGSIARVATEWQQSARLRPALRALLYRERPRIRGREPGAPVLAPARSVVDAAIEAVANLDDSVLAIQGPPGAGKTYTAARIICHLIDKMKKRVGISSNSHDAILKLMEEVFVAADELGIRVNAVKIGNTDELLPNALVERVQHVQRVRELAGPWPQLVGGTAWAFSAPEAVDQLDYLFIDEAGQVSLANAVGMAPATRNLVLLGDQMQLRQPLKGAHPGDSGKSVLEYLFDGHATIPADQGIFLAETYRLHPRLCDFISGAVYENRLLPVANTASRVIQVPAGAKHVPIEAGLLFLPVQHDDNTQASDEEVAAIVGVVGDLIGRTLQRGGAASVSLTRDDILVVAPYNLQVRKLEAALPGIRVGSVDRFQGQEAPVVILSMCASNGEASARGVEFLFNLNRLNVALSRAQSLAIAVGHPDLARTRITSVEQMRLVNMFCRVVEQGAVIRE